MEELRAAHHRIAEHFALNQCAGDSETKSLYFLDHGLSADECEGLRSLVQEALWSRPLSSFEWSSAYLPLIVCAVEVGYGYEGNGTDFWPTMDKSLGYSFSIDDRVQLSHWFSKASKQYGGVTPGDSDWERAFCHIAWPITHAVAAKDIRRPFADCLRRFNRDVKNEQLLDETIVSDLASISTSVGSRRFRTWLNRETVVAGVVRDLLGGRQMHETGTFSSSFRDRLVNDLKGEPDIRHAVRSVEARRKTRSRKTEERTSDSKDKSELLFGDFFLTQGEHGTLQLYGELPALPKSTRRQLNQVRRRWQPRPWGYAGATGLPSDALRSLRGTFAIDFSYVIRAGDKAFFHGLEELSLDGEAEQWLSSVRFHVAEKLVFLPVQADGEPSYSLTSPTPHTGSIWVLAKAGLIAAWTAECPEAAQRLVGTVDGGEVHEFDAANAQVRAWLGWPEARAKSTKNNEKYTWLRPSPIAIDTKDRPVFTTDDDIGIAILEESGLELVLRQGQNELSKVSVSSVALVELISKGNYELMVRENGLDLETFAFSIIDDEGDGFLELDPEPPWRVALSHVDAGETVLSRKDFFNRRLNLDIIGDRGIENLSAKLTVSPGDSVVAVRLDRIPTRFAANHPIWDELSQQLPTAVLKSQCDLLLSVEIEGLSHDTWLLEAGLHELWWEDDEDAMPIAVSDEGPFEVRRLCVINGTYIDDPTEGNPFISVALDGNGNELHFDARIGVVGDSPLQRQLLQPKRFLRQMDDDGDTAGLRSITQKYLQLSCASSLSLTAEFNRVGASQTLRSWILHSVCGPNWIHKQHEISKIESRNPVEVWWECQHAFTSLILPEPDDDSPRELPKTLDSATLLEFFAALPSLWWDFQHSITELSSVEAVNRILQRLSGDSDLYVDEDYLPKSLARATEILCGGDLAEMLIPSRAGDVLMQWSFANTTISELTDWLSRWTRDSLGRGRGRQTWSSEELLDYLNLLLYPERLRKRPWESVLEKLLQDRPVARGGAFVAWRVQQNARLATISNYREELI